MVQMQWIVQWKPLAALSSERNSHAQQHVACTANSRSEQWYDGATVTASLQHSTGSAAASITAFTASIAARSGGHGRYDETNVMDKHHEDHNQHNSTRGSTILCFLSIPTFSIAVGAGGCNNL